MPDRKKPIALLLSLIFCAGYGAVACQAVLAEVGELNFKVYNPDQKTAEQGDTDGKSVGADLAGNSQLDSTDKDTTVSDSTKSADQASAGLSAEVPKTDVSPEKVDSATKPVSEVKSIDEASSNSNEEATSGNKSNQISETEVRKNTDDSDNANQAGNNKVLQGYVRIVPSGTKIPIVMDTAVDSDTSQEGDEFSARTVEDLTIDGTMVIPAGSIIRGRIATLNAPKHLNRSGSVALKFDTVTTPDNRQIPLVANLVAHGGVVHARRGMKDIAIDSATFGLPTLVALGIGAVAGHSSSSVGVGGGALIGAGVGAAVGLAILLAKKGKKVDVRPGDELKIELAEDLHMPAM